MATGGKSPVEVEATEPVGATVDVEWDGHQYKVPASLEDCDLDAIEAFAEGNAFGFVRSVLGDEQWQSLKERQRGKPHRFAELRNAIGTAMGYRDEGESEASST